MRVLPELSKALDKDQRVAFSEITNNMAKSGSKDEAMALYNEFMDGDKANSMDTSFLESFISEANSSDSDSNDIYSLDSWLIGVEIDIHGITGNELTSLEELQEDGYDFNKKHHEWIKELHERTSKTIHDNPEVNVVSALIYDFRGFDEHSSISVSEFDTLLEYKIEKKHHALTGEQYVAWYEKSKKLFNEDASDLNAQTVANAREEIARLLDRTGVSGADGIEGVLTSNYFKPHFIHRELFIEKVNDLIEKEVAYRSEQELGM